MTHSQQSISCLLTVLTMLPGCIDESHEMQLDDLRGAGDCNNPLTALGAASSGYSLGLKSSALRVIDGNPNTVWQSQESDGSWITIDLGDVESIDRVRVSWGWDTIFGDSAISVIEGSVDGGKWTTLNQSIRQAGDDFHALEQLAFPAASVRYVRLRATAWNGGTGFVGELQALGACEVDPCEEDLAFGRPVTSSGYRPPHVPNRAVDHDLDSMWGSNQSNGAWLQVDLGEPQFVGRARVAWVWDAEFGNEATSVIEGSLDGNEWAPLAETTRYAGVDLELETLDFQDTVIRYVRFRALEWNGGWGQVNSLEILPACPDGSCGVEIARNGDESSSGHFADHTPGLAFDGSLETRWSSSQSTDAWLLVDLEGPRMIGQARISWGAESGGPATSVLEASLDGQTWTTLVENTPTPVDPTMLEVLEFEPIPAVFVRLRATQWNGGLGWVNELEVYGACLHGQVCDPGAPLDPYATALPCCDTVTGDELCLERLPPEELWDSVCQQNASPFYNYCFDGTGCDGWFRCGGVGPSGCYATGEHEIRTPTCGDIDAGPCIQRCGDGLCEAPEDPGNCRADCPATANDGICHESECSQGTTDCDFCDLFCDS